MSQPNPYLGLVSNCWQVQLARGESLDALIAEAAERGFGAIELRQGCLGAYESGEPRLPDAAALAVLAERFPQMRLRIAIELPFLTGRVGSADMVFAAGQQAATAIGKKHTPHLRLVDLATHAIELADVDEIATSLAALARAMIDVNGILSVEHARQSWSAFSRVFQSARRQLGAEASGLRLCYDPVNLFLSREDVDPDAVTASLARDEISMVHFKQRCDGYIAPAVCDGDVDWQAQLDALGNIGYRGPYLYEVASHKNLWEYLKGSHEYLRRRGLDVAPASSGQVD